MGGVRCFVLILCLSLAAAAQIRVDRMSVYRAGNNLEFVGTRLTAAGFDVTYYSANCRSYKYIAVHTAHHTRRSVRYSSSDVIYRADGSLLIVLKTFVTKEAFYG